MLNSDESKVAFADAPGQKAITVLRRFVDEGKMPDIRPETMFQDYFAGRMGIAMQSTAQLGRFNREVGGRFPVLCGRYPLSAPNARLPAGGNVAMMFAKDPVRQKAAWEFIKFATGPIGATMMVILAFSALFFARRLTRLEPNNKTEPGMGTALGATFPCTEIIMPVSGFINTQLSSDTE